MKDPRTCGWVRHRAGRADKKRQPWDFLSPALTLSRKGDATPRSALEP